MRVHEREQVRLVPLGTIGDIKQGHTSVLHHRLGKPARGIAKATISQRSVVKVDDWLSRETAVLLGCGVLTAKCRLEDVTQGYQDLPDGKNIRGVIVH
ncbi:MAG: hypothetical protein K2X97_21655 [Mycobacteriaceae bacterium]|nr:hypothetical protein [Mycobacteriaceae bacterium]